MFRQLITCTMLLASSMVLTLHAVASTRLTAALANRQVDMNAVKNAESYHGKGLDLQLKNKTNQTISISIDPAMIFEPDDSNQQNLVIVHDEVIVLKANEERTISVQSFCAKSYASAPEDNMHFSYWKQGDTTMIQLLRYIVANHVSTSLAQNAVWVLTNGHSLSYIYSGSENEEAQKLVTYLSGLLHTTPPTQYMYHRLREIPKQPVYDPKPLKMMAKFDYIAETDEILTLGVYSADGSKIESVFDNKPFGKGGHRFTVEFEAADVPAGKYYIRLIREGLVIKEQEVSVP